MSDLKKFVKTINPQIAKGVAVSHLLRLMPEIKPTRKAAIEKEASNEVERISALKMLDMITDKD